MRSRTISRVYNLSARIWLLAAALSLLLPAGSRLGYWLPLHLALAGAATTAISGNMQTFAGALTGAPDPPAPVVAAQFSLVTLGAALIAAGYPTGHGPLVAAGGTCFLFGLLLLGWIVIRAWRRGLNHRHPVPVAMYLTAIAAVLAGGALGAMLGSGGITDGAVWAALRRTHLTVNLLGFISMTIAATLFTLFPTVLRVRMPAWPAAATGGALAAGVALLALGLALQVWWLAEVGACVEAVGAGALAGLIVKTLRSPRRWPVPAAGLHLAAAGWWLFGGMVGLAATQALYSFDAYFPVLMVTVVCGWMIQALLGGWLYLLPVNRPGDPSERRVQFTALEVAGRLQVIAVNLGLVLLALAAGRHLPETAGWVGAGIALFGGVLAFAKTWFYAALARHPGLVRRARESWDLR